MTSLPFSFLCFDVISDLTSKTISQCSNEAACAAKPHMNNPCLLSHSHNSFFYDVNKIITGGLSNGRY